MHQHKNSIAMKWQKATVISYQRHVQNTENFLGYLDIPCGL